MARPVTDPNSRPLGPTRTSTSTVVPAIASATTSHSSENFSRVSWAAFSMALIRWSWSGVAGAARPLGSR